MANEATKPENGEATGDEQPRYLTADEAQKMVNGAVAAERKKVKEELAALAKLRAEWEERSQPKQTEPQEEERKTWTSRIKALEDAKAKSDEKYREKHISSEFRRAWTSKGKLDAEFADDHMAALRGRGAIKMDDDERVWVGDVPLEDYVSEFAKSEKGKRYQAIANASSAGGPGRGPKPTPVGKDGKMSYQEARQVFANAMMGEKPPGTE